MGTFVVPKRWTTQETLLPSQLNQLLAAIGASANAITDDQVGSAAAIVGTKIAGVPNGIPTDKYNPNAVTLGKLAVGVFGAGTMLATSSFGQAQHSGVGLVLVPGELTLITAVAIAPRGGLILIWYGISGGALIAGSGRSFQVILANGSGVIREHILGAATVGVSPPMVLPLGITGVFAHQPAAGVELYELSVILNGANINDVAAVNSGYAVAMEMA